MIPSRTTLATWRPEGLTDSAPTVSAAGDNLERTSSDARNFCTSLPIDKGWTGVAHDAAQNAFDRGFKTAAHIADVCTAVSSALTVAYHAVSRATTDLLDAVERVEASGKFTVDDQWVVELAAIPWTAKQIDDARAAQRGAQTEINEQVVALGAADDPQTLLHAVKSLGIEVGRPQGILPMLVSGSLPPADEAPNPVGMVGALMQQDVLRRQWEASTPRKVTENHVLEHDGFRGYRTKTLEMQDGSRQEISVDDPWAFPRSHDAKNSDRDTVSVTTYDPSGAYVSRVTSWKLFEGETKFTTTEFANGTSILFTQTPDGKKTASINVGGYSREIPTDDKLWQHPISDLTGGALTGLEKGVEKAGQIPSVSAATVSKIEVGARYAGPAVGIATSLVDMYRASTLEDKCVAGAAGTGGFVGGELGGQVGAWGLGSLTKSPVGAGVGGAGGTMAGGWIGSYVGTQLGNLLCR